jgi:hypothetical protein
MAKVAENILGGKHHVVNAGHGTPLSGYIESDVPRACGTCEYLEKGTLCRNRKVLRDPKVPRDKNSNLKIVDPVYGCCDEWVSSAAAEARAAKGEFEKALQLVQIK